MLNLILNIIDTGAKLLLFEQKKHIQDLVAQMRRDYAEEEHKPFDQIDDARLYSIKSELRNLISVYSSAVEGQILPPQPPKAG